MLTFVKKIGIIAGGGQLPFIIMKSLQAKNLEYFVIFIQNAFEGDIVANTSHAFCEIGQIGKMIRLLNEQQISDLVFVGHIKKPSLANLNVDKEGVKLLYHITKAKIFGDDAVFKVIIKFLEKRNFNIVSPQTIAPNLTYPVGTITKTKPTEKQSKDIEFAIKVAHTLGELDIGQSVIIEEGVILGVEAAEGTDELIKRCKFLKKEKKQSGVLIKVKKPKQEKTIDLPTIGVNTIYNLYQSGFKGLAIEANYTLILEIEQVKKIAEELNIFIVSV